jgi:DNA (cytosine-5)-methyltransferase 1
LPNKLSERHFEGMSQAKNEVDKLSIFHDYDFKKYKGSQLLNKIARNLVDYEAGKTILEIACGIIKQSEHNQIELF